MCQHFCQFHCAWCSGNGECMCEEHGYGENECLQIGCCQFDNGEVRFCTYQHFHHHKPPQSSTSQSSEMDRSGFHPSAFPPTTDIDPCSSLCIIAVLVCSGLWTMLRNWDEMSFQNNKSFPFPKPVFLLTICFPAWLEKWVGEPDLSEGSSPENLGGKISSLYNVVFSRVEETKAELC